MQSYTNIPSTETLTNSRQELLNNDLTIMSNNSGTSFPTTNLQIGMFCDRTDLKQIFKLVDMTPTWKLVFDYNKTATNQEYVDTQLGTRVASTDVVTTPTALKILKLNSSGDLPANVTGSSTSCTGNSLSATKLQTSRKIGGVSFDGTSDITIPYSGLSGLPTIIAHGSQLFTANGTFTVPDGITSVTVICLGGAGGAGQAVKIGTSYYGNSGSGATGQLVVGTFTITSGTQVSVTVGAGGVGIALATSGNSNKANGNAGGISSFGSYLSASGGAGGGGASWDNTDGGFYAGVNASASNPVFNRIGPYENFSIGGAGSPSTLSTSYSGTSGFVLVMW